MVINISVAKTEIAAVCLLQSALMVRQNGGLLK